MEGAARPVVHPGRPRLVALIEVREVEPDDRPRVDWLFRDAHLGAGIDADDLGLVAVDRDSGLVVGAMAGDLTAAELDEQLAALVELPQAFLAKIVIDPDHRRGGAARALLGVFARRALEAGSTHAVGIVAGQDDRGGRAAFFAACGLEVRKLPTSNNRAVVGRLDDVVAACPEP